MTIRRAVTDDVSQLVELAREEHAASFLAHTPFDGACAANFHRRWSTAWLGRCSSVAMSMAVQGLIAGVAQQNFATGSLHGL